ncbi:MAG: hypothetical protein UR80_C0012G0002 [Parcubacteria group bacterium GW2011_GWB1_35_5]|uniref:Uncharacterized protein n=1 Tax=Candidatus Zambryskibacteria bacterium RIFCSPLOWO2_01_FULL_35_19 TaxID=1802757 RepID=A0A1G2TW54_9BACT|nr:MAG: hypothetical protein UR50_C0010G0009 [Parcubacteria group bacterium GW2011_GWC1_34_10]KKP80986.1 MAG: hypothetical protein UR80_C0012G0002 [Parcubacteria group bacterium GW2011_GWB1_35_5]OHB01545.1 MAG: hypothetical protein A3A90_01500 [Candidatus Zambryskibacteria bacterium RIFCSPLOWO2_01_FULL_35_19]
MNIKKILGIVLIFIVVGILAIFAFRSEGGTLFTNNDNPIIDSISGDSLIKQKFSGQNFFNTDTVIPSESNNPKDIAWTAFQKYLKYNKEQNLEGVKSVVYKVAPICEDLKDIIDCKARMSSAYAYGGALEKKDFVNIWSDEKQIILATNFKIQEDDSILGRHRAIIFFVKDNESLKLLSFSPFKGATVSKGVASREEIDDRLIIYTEDKDEDGIADYDEECLSPKEGEVCVKTNPKIRDTDGDGLWDGVQALMTK